MRKLHLQIGENGSIEGATIISDTPGDQELVEKVLNQILEKENPTASSAGPNTETKLDLG